MLYLRSKNKSMAYTVQQLAKLASVSVRTLHYYDQIGLLSPSRVKANGYRYYEEPELLRLQQILFFKELDFPLERIKSIIDSPSFDMKDSLLGQRNLIELKKNRLAKLIKTIDKTIKKINKEINMNDEDLYGNFTKEEYEKYTAEAKERWGHTDAWRESQERVRKMGKEGLKKALDEGGQVSIELAEAMKKGLDPKSTEVQEIIQRHYNWLKNFYEPGPEMYIGLANMYVEDERFTKNIDKTAPGLAAYMREGMIHFAKNSR